MMQNADSEQSQKMLTEIAAKYETLKGNYAQLLSSFDQSEELRKVYKQLIVD